MTKNPGETPLTEERVALSVGGMFKPEWTNVVPQLASVRDGLNQMGKTVLALGRAAEQVEALPPGHRALRTEALAKTGRGALGAIDQAEGRALGVADSLIERFNADSEKQLARPARTEPNHNFAMSEIRTSVRTAKNPNQKAHGLIGDVEALRAVLSAPAAASGLTPEQRRVLRLEAETKFMPHVFEGRRVALAAREEVVRSAEMARELAAQAAGLVQTASGWRAPWELPEE